MSGEEGGRGGEDRAAPAGRKRCAADRRLGYRTLEREVSDRSLEVEGSIPSWVDGSLLRTGPAKFEVGGRRLRHWFDGLAMLHRFAIADGRVRYSNRYLESREYRHADAEGELGYAEFATDPCRTIFERFFSLFSPSLTDNANVNVSTLADRFVAMTETPLPVEFDPETLETAGVVEYDDALDGTLTTAHPHHDGGATYNYVTRFSRESTYEVFRIPDGGTEREVLASVDRKRPAYMHSFGLTDSYVVLAEFPFVVNPLRLALGSRPFVENYRWEPERGTRFVVIDREDGAVVAEPTTEAFFAFHHVNAFEDGEEVVVDIVAYDDASVIDALYLDELESPDFQPPGGYLTRFRIGDVDGRNGEGSGDGSSRERPGDGDDRARPGDGNDRERLRDGIRRERRCELPLELPRINYGRCNAAPYRYVYAVGNRHDPPRDVPNRLVKVDVADREAAVWAEPRTYPGEPVFVAAPDATAEDDGVVLSVVLDAAAERSFLLVLEAATFEELGRASVGHHVPLGFHGSFYDL